MTISYILPLVNIFLPLFLIYNEKINHQNSHFASFACQEGYVWFGKAY